jgi:hypothetical protein
MRFFLLIIVLVAPLLAQDAAPSDDQEWLQKAAGLETMFRNPPEKFRPLSFHHIDTVTKDGVQKVRYSISAAGLDSGTPYVLMAWALGAETPQVLLPAVQVDKKGVLRCGPEANDCPGGAGAVINVAVSDTPGQPSRFLLADEDEQPLAIGEIIPTPSTVKDHGCSLESILLRSDATIVLVLGQGFNAGEDIKVISTSFDEHVANSGKANANGDYQTVVLPIAKDHADGETMVTMNSSACELSTHFHWGTKPEEAAPPTPATAPPSTDQAQPPISGPKEVAPPTPQPPPPPAAPSASGETPPSSAAFQ